MADRGGVADRWRALTLEQKLSVGVLGVAGLVAFTFGLIQVRASLIRPFTTDVQTLVELRKQFGPTDEEVAEEQKKTDTDGDGVSDYDELVVYRSSPYVRDSDSDGEPDNIEIAKGTDPNCAKGKNCVGLSATQAATGTTSGFTPPPATDYPEFPGGTNASAIPPRDATAVRAYLRASGMTDAQLASYTDAQLLEAYDQSTESIGSSGGGENPSAP